jgi:FkbM family methyltransferase
MLSFFGDTRDGGTCDHILRGYFQDYAYKGVIFDVGAFDPQVISNSQHFFLNGWKSYCFEGNPDNIGKFEGQCTKVFNYAIADTDLDQVTFHNVTTGPRKWTAGYSAINISDTYKRIFGWNSNFHVEERQVPQRTLNTVIKDQIPDLTKIDILSVDVEGGELSVLKGLDIMRWKPKVIVVDNPDKDLRIQAYLEPYGYRLDRQDFCDQYYVYQSYKIPCLGQSPVVSASYTRYTDYADIIRQLQQTFTVSNSLLGDPCPGVMKFLTINLADGQQQIYVEGDTVKFDMTPTPPPTLVSAKSDETLQNISDCLGSILDRLQSLENKIK